MSKISKQLDNKICEHNIEVYLDKFYPTQSFYISNNIVISIIMFLTEETTTHGSSKSGKRKRKTKQSENADSNAEDSGDENEKEEKEIESGEGEEWVTDDEEEEMECKSFKQQTSVF